MPTVIVNEGVAEIRRKPDHRAEQVSQAVLGTPLVVSSWRSGKTWCRVRTPDRYPGWVRAWSVEEMSRSECAAYQNGPLVEVDSMVARVREKPSARSAVLREAPLGARLRRLGRSGKWVRVLLPDGDRGYLSVKDLLLDRETFRPRRRPRDTQYLLRTAHRFLGVPYQWGGITAKGLDCSGLVQTVYSLHGVLLPRDSKDQYRWVKQRAYMGADPGDSVYGHLVFFGEPGRPVSHVGMGLSDGRYIHARGRVRINSLRPDAPDFHRELFRMYRGSGPVLFD